MLKPPPDLDAAQWADKYRYLSAEDSAERGKWVTSRAEYQRGMMAAPYESSVTQTCYMTSAQIGKTAILLNIAGRAIHISPTPILLVQPTIDLAKDFSTDRLTPLLRDSPALKGKVRSPRDKDSGNTRLHKIFSGGYIVLGGANSAASLAGRPIGLLIGDEIDRWPADCQGEGDPWELAKKRTQTFPGAIRIAVSTPTEKGFSRIERLWNESDQRRFFVPCPECGVAQTLEWGEVVWDTDGDGEPVPETARIRCQGCGYEMDDRERLWAVERGYWEATAQSSGVAGFHVNELYSPFSSLSEVVQKWREVKDNPVLEKSFWNLVLGLPYEGGSESLDAEPLLERREEYPAPVPAGASILTCGVDIQKNRIELEVVGWGRGYESWGIEYRVLLGNTLEPEVWRRLSVFLLKSVWAHESGVSLKIATTCVDAGYHSDQVYDFVKKHRFASVYAVQGDKGQPTSWIVKFPDRFKKGAKRGRLNVPIVGTYAAKQNLYERLELSEPGPGYCHFPVSEGYDEKFFGMLTAEKLVEIRGKRRWVLKYGFSRNEALDLRVYNHAALVLAGANWDTYEAQIGKAEKARKTAENKEKPAQKQGVNRKYLRELRRKSRKRGPFGDL